MLRPVKMSKLRAICLKAIAPSVIKALQKMEAVHLKDAELPQTGRAGPLPSYDDISQRLVRIRAMRDLLGKSGKLPKRKLSIENPIKEADELLAEQEKLQAMLKEREEASRELEALAAQQRQLSELAPFNLDFSELSSDSLQFLLLKSSEEKIKTARRILPKRKNCSFVAAGRMLLVAIPKTEEPKFLEGYGTFVPLPALRGTPSQELERLNNAAQAVRQRLEAAQSRLRRFSDAHYPKIVAVEEALSIEAERARVSTMFSSTEALYYIEGYVEASRFKHIALELHRQFGKKIHVYDAGIDGHRDRPPTLLSNPKPAKPFQFLVEFISLPQYSEIDPTLFLMFFTPILYALILGDAVYAVISFILASYFLKITKPGGMVHEISKIWKISAVPAFIAGVLFDEWGGFTHQHLLAKFGIQGALYQAYLHRISEVQSLMLVVIVLGMIHLALGFVLGAINEWNHSRKHAYAKLAWLGVEISGFFLVASGMFGAFGFLFPPALALFLASAAVLVWSEGAVSIFEIPGLASNIMSYIRIAAVGVGGVILAEAINELLFPRLELSLPGFLVFVIMALIYVSVHVISCIIAMFESFVHGARLSVVEFFGKFYHGNGLPFRPFAARRVYTEEC
ncbi:MAG: hypothetical protein N3E51_01505 [Candidatus Micrarchaeota archaeon]|nr:hypothetical protein [Candidatus Micrarchaeota archaeon]